MSQLAYTFTFSTGQTILASSINANYTSIASVINGALGHDNMGTLEGVFTWNVSSTSALAQNITTLGQNGAIKITQNGVMGAAKSGFWITSSAAQTTGDALVFIEQSSSSSTIPALKVSTSVGEMLAVRKAGTTLRPPSVAKTTTYTATATDEVILCSTSGGAWTLTLPAASTSAGIHYKIKKTDSSANHLTIDGNSSETIDGATTFKLHSQYEQVEIFCDGTSWHIISYNGTSGTYTPVATGILNLGAVTNLTAFYVKEKSLVTVFGRCDVDPTSAAIPTTFRITLPIASNLAASTDLHGFGNDGEGNARFNIMGDSTNDAATFDITPTANSNENCFFSFQYVII